MPNTPKDEFKGFKELEDRRYASRLEIVRDEWQHFSQMGSNHKHGNMSWTAYKEMRFKAFDEIDKKIDRDHKWR